MNARAYLNPAAFAVLIVLAASGCGSDTEGVVAKGQLMNGSEKVSITKDDYILVTFHPTSGGDDKIYTAQVEPNGTFTVSKGVPAGKYKVSITSPDPTKPAPFGGKFTQDKTQLTLEVSEDKPDLGTIDVSQ